MKKCIKWGSKILGVLVLLAVVGLVALRIMFPPEKVKQLVLDYAQNTLHREVTFESVSFNLIGVTLNQFALSENSSFAQGTFVKADRLSVKAALWPLFKKQIEIASVYLDGLEVNIQKNKDGSFNFDSFNWTKVAEGFSCDSVSPNAEVRKKNVTPMYPKLDIIS